MNWGNFFHFSNDINDLQGTIFLDNSCWVW